LLEILIVCNFENGGPVYEIKADEKNVVFVCTYTPQEWSIAPRGAILIHSDRSAASAGLVLRLKVAVRKGMAQRRRNADDAPGSGKAYA
jgi:hypothetical protein